MNRIHRFWIRNSQDFSGKLNQRLYGQPSFTGQPFVNRLILDVFSSPLLVHSLNKLERKPKPLHSPADKTFKFDFV